MSGLRARCFGRRSTMRSPGRPGSACHGAGNVFNSENLNSISVTDLAIHGLTTRQIKVKHNRYHKKMRLIEMYSFYSLPRLDN